MIDVTIIHCWSAPRSRSTALMYSFHERKDCMVLDEPLYRRWLEENKESVTRPYTEELINGIPPKHSKPEDRPKWEKEKEDLNSRILSCIENMCNDGKRQGIIFLKHIAKHAPLFNFEKDCEMNCVPLEVDEERVHLTHKHLLLIRDPLQSLSSWNASNDVHNGNVNAK
jgi:hypothetical protein